jgi:hypothetical protein
VAGSGGGVLSSHVWEPDDDPQGRLAPRAGDAAVGVQDKTFARATALVKLPRDRSGNALTPTLVAHERLAAQLGHMLDLPVNEVFLLPELAALWGERAGMWASLHCLVPEPFQRLEEFAGGNDIWSGEDKTTLANDEDLRAIPLFDAFIGNTDRHPGNVLVSGGRVEAERWAYFIDHAYAFAGATTDGDLAQQIAGRGNLKRFVEQQSTMQALWDGAGEEQRAAILPLGRRIAELRDEDLDDLVRYLPDEVAPRATRRFLGRLLRHHITIVRDEIE